MKMNKVITAAMTALILTACAADKKGGEPSVIEGRFIGYAGEFVEFFYIGEDGYVEAPIKVAEDGTFRDTVDFGTDMYDLSLFADRNMFKLCIEQGKHYTAEFDLTSGPENDYRFFGEGEKENLFLSHYWSTFSNQQYMLNICTASTSFDEYLDSIDKVAAPLDEELHSIGNRAFVKYYEKDFTRLKATYQNLYSLVSVNALGVYVPEKSYLKALKLNNKLSDKEFSRMVDMYATYAPYLYPELNLSEALKAVADFGNNAWRKDYAVSSLIKSFVKSGCNNKLHDAYAQYKAMVSSPDAELCARIENAINLGQGAMAPEIEFEDIDGKKYCLADFRGKALYIDLWASWCRPCCAEIPHLAKLVDVLGSDPEIVCISISIDQNRDDWTAKLAEGDEKWPQFIANAEGKRAISEDYSVSAIPRFILLDAEGRIVSVNAPRPSTQGIRETLFEMINTNYAYSK